MKREWLFFAKKTNLMGETQDVDGVQYMNVEEYLTNVFKSNGSKLLLPR